MQGQTESPTQRVMDRIDDERRRDAFVRRVSKVAWTVTFVIILVLAVLTTLQIKSMLPVLEMAGGAGMTAIIGLAMPLVLVLGALSVLVATLSTVGIFLRLRTASLHEIQLRLASLEEMVIASAAAREQR